ncbi:major facilitator superfamily domain-containing protein [Aspergillus caelatus]|uniref:Major facilitator superfamily domain-containing protein n=1 Tax=Aspergillus caelatus TaxID=61420 RepID=A0A5N7A541_9EURO|nr:major facilitator superfamily domain-containing protein [Aspergillus caelatus]KAE8363630.1 major facilitator superfamily domain-containing protein [Aspergillus caelatus]
MAEGPTSSQPPEKSDIGISTETPIIQQGTTHSDFPEGGRQAWLVVFGSWCALFSTFGLVTCIGVFLEYYKNGPLANYTASQISWITSVQVFLQVGSSILWGRLYDSYGPRWLFLLGTPLHCFGLMMTSLSRQYYQIFISQAILSSIGSGTIFNASLTSTTAWFYKRRGMVFGIVNSGSSLARVVLPIMMTRLFQSIGFRWTLRVLGFMFLALCSIACATVKTRLPPNRRPISVTDYIRPLRELKMILTAQANGISPTLVPYLLPIINAVSLIGRLLMGVAADLFGRFNCIIAITAMSGIMTLALWIPGSTSTAAVIIYAVCFGLGSGGYVTLFPSCVTQISDFEEIGTRLGIAQLINAFGALTGSPLGGALIRGQGSDTDFLGLQVFCGVTMIASAVVFGAARYSQVGMQIVKV